MMFDLYCIRDLLAEERRKRLDNPDHIKPNEDRSFELMIEAIDEGRVRIVPRETIID